MALRRRELFNGGAGLLAVAGLGEAPSTKSAQTPPAVLQAPEFASLSEARLGRQGGRVIVRTAGYGRAGDGGAALYRAVQDEPGHSGKFRDASGAWFEYAPGPEGVSAAAFGAVEGNISGHGAALQAAIDFAHGTGGGKVLIGAGAFVLSPEGLRLRENVILQGAVGRYAGQSIQGTTLTYSGNSAAVHGSNVVDAQIRELDIDCSRATGSLVRGVSLSGCWKTSLKNLTVRGVPPERGVAILLDTNSDAFGKGRAWGAQHNYLEQVECADGILAILGRSANDGVTTTVCNTVRGFQYIVASSQVIFMNSTAEGWSRGAGFDFRGEGCFGLLLGCDIEGDGPIGIKVAPEAEVREVGTLWQGFSGRKRVDGRFASMRSYGGPIEFVGEFRAGVPEKILGVGDSNVSNFIEEWVVPETVVGGNQSGYRIQRRLIGGTSYVDHDWRDHALLRRDFIAPGAAPHLLMSVALPNGQGAELRAVVVGSQTAIGPYLLRRSARVLHYDGRILLDQDSQVRIEGERGAAGEIEFVVEGQSVLIRLLPSFNSPSLGTVNLEILGSFAGWT